jgi:deoxycytidine triphosphate deaminase
MIMTDADISKILETSRNVPNDQSLIINPFEERCLTPIGYDLRVGDRYQLLHEGVDHRINKGDFARIPPGETVSVRTMEWIAMPKDGSVAGFICSRVMLVASGAAHISTTVDTDWVGNLLISFTNLSKTVLELPHGERVCTIVFIATKSKPRKLSQHSPGRSDALNENASRIASIYKQDRRRQYTIRYMIWVLSGLVYAGLVYWTNLNYGSNLFFIALVAAGLVLFGFGVEVIRFILGKK